MYFFYVDESGTRNPKTAGVRSDRSKYSLDWLYVLTGLTLFEHHWHGFNKTIDREKTRLIQRIYRDCRARLELADCEIKSNWVRNKEARRKRPFLQNLTPEELRGLVDLYYRQLAYHNMHVFAVIVDKRHLLDYMDAEKIHRKSWELLCELAEQFMRGMHPKHQAIMVADDVSRQLNRSLAMKHSFLQDQGTAAGMCLTRICEMPMFVRSELSNGVQLADLCAYNIYRAFKYSDLAYRYFRLIAPRIWSQANLLRSGGRPFSGLTVFPANSPLTVLAKDFEKERASTASAEAPDS